MIRMAQLEEIIPLRIEILRNGKLKPPAHNPEDLLEGTFHVCYLYNENIIGIASFHPVSLNGHSGNGYQLRGMAVKTEFQNQGIGKKILIFGENELKKRGIEYIWCNARERAFPFYEKMGYHYISDFFEIPLIGLHKKMLKKL